MSGKEGCSDIYIYIYIPMFFPLKKSRNELVGEVGFVCMQNGWSGAGSRRPYTCGCTLRHYSGCRKTPGDEVLFHTKHETPDSNKDGSVGSVDAGLCPIPSSGKLFPSVRRSKGFSEPSRRGRDIAQAI